jgi:serine O-acetyltransferase
MNTKVKSSHFNLELLFRRLVRLAVAIVAKKDIRCKVPKTTIFNHSGVGVVMATPVILGDHCIIGCNVTLGEGHSAYPNIGDYVIICAHTIVIGGINIGHHSVIGAGAVVISDIPPYSLVVGNPARVVKTITEEQYQVYRSKRR